MIIVPGRAASPDLFAVLAKEAQDLLAENGRSPGPSEPSSP